MQNAIKRQAGRKRRKRSIRKRITGSTKRPRLSVFRSSRHIYGQVINDITQETLVSASTLETDLRDACKDLNGVDAAKLVGELVAKRCAEKGIEKVVFDRNGYIYHGRVQALADGAREEGLQF